MVQAATGEQGQKMPETRFAENAQASLVVVDEEGLNYQTLYQSSAGEWENNASGAYSDNGASERLQGRMEPCGMRIKLKIKNNEI